MYHKKSVTIESISPKQLVLALRQSLSQPPSEVGMRLQSEEKLASELNIGRRQVRKAIDLLVNDGVLVRQRGSGTFIRQLAKSPADILLEDQPCLNAKTLFANDGHRSITALRKHNSGAVANKQVLHLGLWGDMHCSTPTNLVTIQGIVDATQQAGHRLSLHSTIISPHVGITPESLADELQRHPCDGYLVTGLWGELFEEALKLTHIPAGCPRVYVGGGRINESLEPVICPDLKHAVRRAMSTLHEQGLKRLTLLIHNQIPNHTVKQLQQELKQFAWEHDCHCELMSEDVSFAGGMKAIRRMFSSSDPTQQPQGIFVFDSLMLEGITEAMQTLKLVPGQDVAVVVLANRGLKLTEGYDWSRLEMDTIQVGRLAVQTLLTQLSEPNQQHCSLFIQAHWAAGQTHTFTKPQLGVR